MPPSFRLAQILGFQKKKMAAFWILIQVKKSWHASAMSQFKHLGRVGCIEAAFLLPTQQSRVWVLTSSDFIYWIFWTRINGAAQKSERQLIKPQKLLWKWLWRSWQRAEVSCCLDSTISIWFALVDCIEGQSKEKRPGIATCKSFLTFWCWLCSHLGINNWLQDIKLSSSFTSLRN